MIYGFLICSGKQTRFKDKVPKCFSNIGDRTVIDINIENLNSVCDKVFVTCSDKNKDYFKDIDNLIITHRNKGSGDTILEALSNIKFNEDDRCIIQWGDSILNKKVYTFLLDYSNINCVIPCRYEIDPYVRLLSHDDGNIEVRFKKYNDNLTNYGFHDLSIFYFNINYLLRYLNDFYIKFFNDDKYNHKHKEFEFLDIFNDTDINGFIIDTSFKSYSFNTKKELLIIEKRFLNDD